MKNTQKETIKVTIVPERFMEEVEIATKNLTHEFVEDKYEREVLKTSFEHQGVTYCITSLMHVGGSYIGAPAKDFILENLDIFEGKRFNKDDGDYRQGISIRA